MKGRWILWLIMLAFVYAVINRLGEIENLARTLGRGQWQWIGAAVGLQALYYAIYATLYQAAFFAVDIRLSRAKLLPVIFAAIFADVAAPTGGASSAAVIVNESAQRGHSPARGMAAVLLGRVTDFSTFLLILLAGLTYLFLQNRLRAYELVMAGLLLIYIGSMSGILLLGRRDPELLRRILHRVQKIANGAARLVGLAEPLPAHWDEQTAAEFTEAALAIAVHPERATRILGAALCLYVVHILCLYVLFLAFRYQIGLGALIGGYSVGMLFWIVSITPHGIGVVEGVMVLLYTSLGVPRETATVVVLSFRGLTFWAPLAIGFVTVRRLRSFRAQRPRRRYGWIMQTTALLAIGVAVLSIVSAAMPAISSRLDVAATMWPLEVRRGGRLAVALTGFVMLTLAHDLRRGRRGAWAAAVLILIISIAGQVLKALDYEPALATGGVLLWLLAMRSRFNARWEPPSVRHGLIVAGLAAVFTLAYGAIGFNLLANQFSRNYPLGPAVWQSIALWTQFWAPRVRPLTSFARFFVSTVYVVGLASTAYGLLITLRAATRTRVLAGERSRAADIVQNYGDSEMAYYALLADKVHWFSPGGSVIAYTLKGRVVVALSRAFGPPEDEEAAVAAFRRDMGARRLRTAFYLVPPDRLPMYRRAGFEVVEVGLQGELELTDGASLRAVRALKVSCARGYREGFRTELYAPPLDENLTAELGAVNDEWLAITGEMETRFAMGWFHEDYVRGRPVMVVKDRADNIAAFASLIVDDARRVVSVDMVRRRHGVDPSVMEFLWSAVLLWAREDGFGCVNLGLSPAPDRGADPVRHYLHEHVAALYRPRGLDALRERVRPRWSPRYLAYPDEASLPSVLSALVRADSGEDFLWDNIADVVARRLARRDIRT